MLLPSSVRLTTDRSSGPGCFPFVSKPRRAKPAFGVSPLSYTASHSVSTGSMKEHMNDGLIVRKLPVLRNSTRIFKVASKNFLL